MYFKNPILNADYSDPDIIKVNDGYYLVSSSFNYVPGVPVCYSKDLVNFKIISYAIKKLPPFYNKVQISNGAWAPSINYHNGLFYIFIPFPDEGIFYTTSKDPFLDDWSELKPLYLLKGAEDPTVLFENGKAYLIFAFVKSRIGFNSKLGLVEFSEDLSTQLTKDYKIIYDGTNTTPTIEGPKIYKFFDKYYIFAPAFGVEHGKQLQLVSDNIYGPYKVTISLEEGNNINGPHQGGLVHIKDNDYAFIHFSFDKELGRIVYLEPAKYNAKTQLFELGNNKKPVKSGYINTNKDKSNFIVYSDNFKSSKLNYIWQTPANVDLDYLKPTKEGLILKTKLYKEDNLSLFPYVLSQKFSSNDFISTLDIDILNIHLNDCVGITIIGDIYGYILICKKEKYYLIQGYQNNQEINDKLIKELKIQNINNPQFKLEYHDNTYKFLINGIDFLLEGVPVKQHYIGLRYGIFTFNKEKETNSYIKLLNYKIESRD